MIKCTAALALPTSNIILLVNILLLSTSINQRLIRRLSLKCKSDRKSKYPRPQCTYILHIPGKYNLFNIKICFKNTRTAIYLI